MTLPTASPLPTTTLDNAASTQVPYGSWWDTTMNGGLGGWREISDAFPQPVAARGTVLTPLITPTLSVGGTYAIGDYFGVSGTGIAVPNAALSVGGGGLIQAFALLDQDDQGVPCDVYFAGAPFVSGPTDNANWIATMTDANMVLLCPGKAVIATYEDCGTGQMGIAEFPRGAIPYQCAATSLYVFLVTKGTPTYTATTTATLGLRFRIGLLPS